MTWRHVGTLVVFGVAGSGKTMGGTELARRLAVDSVDGDSLLRPADMARMRTGQSLTDQDWDAWLARVVAATRKGRQGVVACSPLRRSHRDEFRMLPIVRVVHQIVGLVTERPAPQHERLRDLCVSDDGERR